MPGVDTSFKKAYNSTTVPVYRQQRQDNHAHSTGVIKNSHTFEIVLWCCTSQLDDWMVVPWQWCHLWPCNRKFLLESRWMTLVKKKNKQTKKISRWLQVQSLTRKRKGHEWPVGLLSSILVLHSDSLFLHRLADIGVWVGWPSPGFPWPGCRKAVVLVCALASSCNKGRNVTFFDSF